MENRGKKGQRVETTGHSHKEAVMDLIFICRDAVENSVISNIGFALEARKTGLDVGVLFTEEALLGMAGESFRWSGLFQGRDMRAKISKNATGMGIEVANQKDSRWTDLSRLLSLARDRGVRLIACPVWVQILDVRQAVSSSLELFETETMIQELMKAKIVGGF